jgi:hypothetical protein
MKTRPKPIMSKPKSRKGMKFAALFITFALLISSLFTPPCFSYTYYLTGIPYSINTPDALAKWFSAEFEYRYEMVQELNGPQETIDSKGGDCEEFAILASIILWDMGIDNDILVISFKGLGMAHAMCVWRDTNGAYCFISNRQLVNTGEKELERAIEKYFPDWTKTEIVDDKMRSMRKIRRG